MTAPDPTATPRQGGAGLTEVIREHRRNEVIEPGPMLSEPQSSEWYPVRTRVKCDSDTCTWGGEFTNWWLAVEAHEAHVAAVLTARLSEPDVVEAAARALVSDEMWRDAPERVRDVFRGQARAALAAAAGVVGGRA